MKENVPVVDFAQRYNEMSRVCVCLLNIIVHDGSMSGYVGVETGPHRKVQFN